MINAIFDACVRLLLFLAGHLGMTYKAINVWIFCVIWPIATLLLVWAVTAQHRTLRNLRRR